jgi:hypothetical protein
MFLQAQQVISFQVARVETKLVPQVIPLLLRVLLFRQQQQQRPITVRAV